MTFNEINNQVNFSESLCPFTNSGILYSPEEDINEREQIMYRAVHYELVASARRYRLENRSILNLTLAV